MIVTAKVRIEHYLSKQISLYIIQFISVTRDVLPLKSLASYYQSPTSRSNVALLLSIHSRQWACVEGRILWGHAEKNRVYSRAYIESICHKVLRQILSELFKPTLQVTPASKLASLD